MLRAAGPSRKGLRGAKSGTRPCVTSRHRENYQRVDASREHKACLFNFTYACETAGCRRPVSEGERAGIGDPVPGATGVGWCSSHNRQARPRLKLEERFEFSAQSHLLAASRCMQIVPSPALQRWICLRWSPAKGPFVRQRAVGDRAWVHCEPPPRKAGRLHVLLGCIRCTSTQRLCLLNSHTTRILRVSRQVDNIGLSHRNTPRLRAWLCTTHERRCVSLHVDAQKQAGHVSMPKFEDPKVYQSVPDEKDVKIKCKRKHVSRAQDAAGCQHRSSPLQARVGINLRQLYHTGHLCLTTFLFVLAQS